MTCIAKKTHCGFQRIIPIRLHGQTDTGTASPLRPKTATHPDKVSFGIGNGPIEVITIAPINKRFSWGAGRLETRAKPKNEGKSITSINLSDKSIT
ncbi:hypothetical protein BC355_14590 [Vibrio cholerae]|uniref:Uncharacterized protein n=1 Tax=Vibrio cholerae TaxID=666 RepID=A0A395TMT9_VIBCL|nr:hypothetical protein BC354_14735 [Vibrio cholerae]RGP85738.1 hypothetical protein BC355_14590 [Vibrio cholerae]RGP86127.1 hypothetical protein BC353_14570 [Vibrio cholerae]RGP94077.1 hypothetical protein BC352_14390 [Vibrio cholerae]